MKETKAKGENTEKRTLNRLIPPSLPLRFFPLEPLPVLFLLCSTYHIWQNIYNISWFICLLSVSFNLNVSSRRAGALPFPALGLLQILSKYLLNDFKSGRLSEEMCVKLGPEDEKKLFVKRSGFGGPCRGNSRCETLRQGKGTESSPEWLSQGEQGGSNTKGWDLADSWGLWNAKPCTP